MSIIARMNSFVQDIDITQVPEVGKLQLAQRFDQNVSESQVPKIPLWVNIQASYACLSPPPSSLQSAESSPRDPARKGADRRGRRLSMLAGARFLDN